MDATRLNQRAQDVAQVLTAFLQDVVSEVDSHITEAANEVRETLKSAEARLDSQYSALNAETHSNVDEKLLALRKTLNDVLDERGAAYDKAIEGIRRQVAADRKQELDTLRQNLEQRIAESHREALATMGKG